MATAAEPVPPGPLRLDSVPAAAVHGATLPGELTDQATYEVASANRANAPADEPAHADALVVRRLRPDLRPRPGDAASGEADVAEPAADKPAADDSVALEQGDGSREIPGMSQPGSVMVASLRSSETFLHP
ncbi:MAG TPA: hypothetical protein VMB74_01630 [Streptosporangiaceae bacterium]|nr:hypothetical protein [Streptosporangiaceae bacterium]